MDPPTLIVRAIDPTSVGTASAIARIQRAAYRIEADLIGYDRIPPLVETEDDVRALDLQMLGALDGDLIVGLVGYAVDGDTVDIDRLAIDPRWFRRGIGRALVTEVDAREPAAARFLVSTGAANTPAVTLYQSLGYRVVGTVTREGCAVTEFVLVRQILGSPTPS
jgi:ribosomal protein S18 acetylase RimI-like enzyme